jgi:hypothetical protein
VEVAVNKILTKSMNYKLCHAGGYGNRIRQWPSYAALKSSDYKDQVAMRVRMGGGGGGPSAFHIPQENVPGMMRLWCDTYGISPDQFEFTEMADSPRILQGEYRNDVVEVDGCVVHGVFRHSFKSGPMPEALKAESFTSYGLKSDLLIRNAMTQASYEDWQELLTLYPGHVLEVSVWEQCIGDLPHRNAIVWEVRMY